MFMKSYIEYFFLVDCCARNTLSCCISDSEHSATPRPHTARSTLEWIRESWRINKYKLRTVPSRIFALKLVITSLTVHIVRIDTSRAKQKINTDHLQKKDGFISWKLRHLIANFSCGFWADSYIKPKRFQIRYETEQVETRFSSEDRSKGNLQQHFSKTTNRQKDTVR